MKAILANDKTKNSLVEYLVVVLKDHLLSRGITFIVSGNHKTYTSSGEFANNHEEAETLLIHCLCSLDISNKVVSVYATDTDICVLLLAHRFHITCKRIMFGTTTDSVVVIDVMYSFLGKEAARCLM